VNNKENVKQRPRVVWKDGKCIICPPESANAGRAQALPPQAVRKTETVVVRRVPVKKTEGEAAVISAPDFFAVIKMNIVAVVLIFIAFSVIVAAAFTATLDTEEEAALQIPVTSHSEADTGTIEPINNMPIALSQPDQISGALVVCIDPGHGFDDVGTSNAELGVYEHEIVLAVGLKLRDKLEEAGVKVYMTHDTNEPPPDASKPYLFGMKKRNGMANSLTDVGLYISVHCDAFFEDTTVYGPRVYHMSDDKGGEGVALEIEKELALLTPEKEIQVKAMSGMNSYQVLRNSDMPAVLVETGFVSNRDEALAMLTEEWQNDIAQALANAIISAYENGHIC